MANSKGPGASSPRRTSGRIARVKGSRRQGLAGSPGSKASSRRAQILILSLIVIACLLPYADKAFHIDDTLHLWTARQIARDPLDFYGFDVNWYGRHMPMYEVNKNPPLVSYYLAGVASLAGWSEVALHLAMVLPALAAILGTYFLACRLSANPLVAALATWITPVVLVSSTDLMCDVTMLALWCWALALWIRGLEERRRGFLLAAAVMAGLCPLAKYFGLSLIPLLVVHAVVSRARTRDWAPFLAVPVAIVGAYQIFMRLQYGWDPFTDVSRYALGYYSKGLFSLFDQTLIGLFFLGGCLLTSLFFAPLLWSRRVLAGGFMGLLAGFGLASSLDRLGPFAFSQPWGERWGTALQMAVFGFAGIHIFFLAAVDLYRRRDAASWVLALWVAGVWVFGSYTNWTTTARSMLPAAPAVGILLGRRLARGGSTPLPGFSFALLIPLVLGLFVSHAVAWADHRLAASARQAARVLSEKYGQKGGRLFFEGAWGFQYYMESAGGVRLDIERTHLKRGDFVFVPENNTNVFLLSDEYVRLVELAVFPGTGWVATHSRPTAGFYTALWAPLPFAFGPAPPERYAVFVVERPLILNR
jgi:4-amino-4-deoxy-L-arabinose transferase-like glycosyltransferase